MRRRCSSSWATTSAEHARRENYTLLSPPHVLLEEDEDLSVGEFGIATRLVQAPQLAARPVAPPPVEAGPPPPVVPPTPAPVPPAPEPAPPVDPGGTRVFEPEPADVTSVVPPPVVASATPRAVLVGGERRFELAEGVAVVGRTKECDVPILDDPSISRRHAEIRVTEGDYWIVDLGSTNGTEVNGKRVSRLRLGNGDRITVGQTTLTFERLA